MVRGELGYREDVFLGFNPPHPDHMGPIQTQSLSFLGLSRACALRSGQRQFRLTFGDAIDPSKPFNKEGVLSGGPQTRRGSERGEQVSSTRAQ